MSVRLQLFAHKQHILGFNVLIKNNHPIATQLLPYVDGPTFKNGKVVVPGGMTIWNGEHADELREVAYINKVKEFCKMVTAPPRPAIHPPSPDRESYTFL